MRWSCPTCGGEHPELPFGFESPTPAHLFAIPETERERRVVSGPGWHEVDGRVAYVHGEIEIPLVRTSGVARGVGTEAEDVPDALIWAAWVALDPAALAEHRACSPFEARDASWLGRLDTVIPTHPDTLGLRVLLHAPRPGRRPFIELEPTDHPLAREQWNGIELDRVREIAGELWHLEDDVE